MLVIPEWETDNQNIELPVKVEVPDNLNEEEIANWLSDQYGWLVNSYTEIG